VTASLAYRNNTAAIIRGDVPAKYLRLLPHIPGERILEIGSAEGVLALLLSKAGRRVVALEKSLERHQSALELKRAWRDKRVVFFNGSIADKLHHLDGKDTLVAVRMIYYLRNDLDRVFAAAAKKVQNVVLCGNRNRANRYRAGVPDEIGGPQNFYASREGMRELLLRHGYSIVEEVFEGDEIVVGRMD
jgi:SAM-dependent methyltransferase